MAGYILETFGGDGFNLTSLFAISSENGFANIDQLTSLTLTNGSDPAINLLASEDWNLEDGKLLYTGGTTEPPIPPVVDPNATPEPATLLMLSLGAIGAGLATRRKMRNGK